MIFSNSDTYEGCWQHNVKGGYGVYKNHNGEIYEGNFERGVRQGSGTFQWSTGDQYNGSCIMHFNFDIKGSTTKCKARESSPLVMVDLMTSNVRIIKFFDDIYFNLFKLIR